MTSREFWARLEAMPVTAIDKETALVVIDIQKGIVRRPTAHPADLIVANVLRLVEAFRSRARPVVLVHVGWNADRSDALNTRVESKAPTAFDPEMFQFVPELKADPERDLIIHKRQWGAFYGTPLDLLLRRRQITGLVLCGIATSIGVESTARDAWERSYNLTFATDAMTDLHLDAHERSLTRIFPRIGELGTTGEIIERL